MKKSTEARVRARFFALIWDFIKSLGEDSRRIADASIAFPAVEDEEETWIEVKVIVHSSWGSDEGYALGDEFDAKQSEKAAKAEAKKKGGKA